MNLVISKCVTAVKVSNFSGHLSPQPFNFGYRSFGLYRYSLTQGTLSRSISHSSWDTLYYTIHDDFSYKCQIAFSTIPFLSVHDLKLSHCWSSAPYSQLGCNISCMVLGVRKSCAIIFSIKLSCHETQEFMGTTSFNSTWDLNLRGLEL